MIYSNKICEKGTVLTNFIDELNKSGKGAVIWMNSGAMFAILPNDKLEIINHNILKVINCDGNSVKMITIDNIQVVENGGRIKSLDDYYFEI